jgi:hypothetical protein
VSWELGFHVLTLKAMDEYGAVDNVSQGINVVALPPNSPPVVTIVNPKANAQFNVDFPMTLVLQGAVNADAGAVTFRWTATSASAGKEIDIGATAGVIWNPLSVMPFPCAPAGGRVTLKLYATNANGTSSASVPIELLTNLQCLDGSRRSQ